jgi:uncharacterized RDD family membrane protein YckC
MTNRHRTGDPYRPASLLRRLGAMLYDALLVLAIWLLTTYLAVLVFTERPEIPAGAETVSLEGMETVQSPWFSAFLGFEAVAFFAFFWLRHGRTLGMQAWRLRIEQRDGSARAMTLAQAGRRMLVALPSLALFGVGYLWQWVDRERLAWPDRASDTRIVVQPKA